MFAYSPSKIRTYTIPQGSTSQVLPNIVHGRLPRSILVGFLHTQSLSGSGHYKPFYFHHFDVNYMSLRINGQNYPSQPLKPNFETGEYMREYRHTIDNCGISNDNVGIGYTFKQFGHGKTLFVFDLTPDQCNGLHLHENK